MDDSISRQVTIKNIEEYMVNPENTTGEHPDDIHNYNKGLLTAIEAVNETPSAHLEQKNGKKFIEIVVEYPAICPHPEYEGKPYFSIRYEENGEKIEGFGTYNPEVLSKYIREYFMGEKKGHWIDARDFCNEFVCSNCQMLNRNNIYKYCPYCGAQMEEE